MTKSDVSTGLTGLIFILGAQDPEMAAIEADDRNCRLVKGQVFLWPGAHGWEDLWDLDGTITK